MEYRTLFTPLMIGSIEIRNRIVTSPMYVGYGNPDGTVSEKMISHYGRRAKGGVGMVITEYICVHESGAEAQNQIQIWKDEALPGLERLASTIKEYGAKAGIQLVHGGRHSRLKERIAPSPVTFEPNPGEKVTPREMTRDEIKEVVRAFSEGAMRAVKCGFDCVEIHGATGYLHAQFISPRLNRRKDEYGGDLEGRMRFAIETVREVKNRIGDVPLGYHFLADEWMPGGFTFEEAKTFAKRLEEEGVSYLIVVGGTYDSWRLPHIQERLQHSPYQVDLASGIKDVVTIPVFANGRIDHPRIAEWIVSSGKADGVALARPLFADPDYPRKAMEGRDKEVVRCIPFCFECLEGYKTGEGSTCYMWPEAIRKKRFYGLED